MLARYVDGTKTFDEALGRLVQRGDDDLSRVEAAVREICAAVRREGDAAVLRYAERFDGRRPNPLVRAEFGGAEAFDRLPQHAREALQFAAERIAEFHQHQRDPGFRYERAGITLGTRVLPLRRVGVYAPGGKARYPSSVLMSAIPARVAGVREIVLATPLSGTHGDDAVLAAAHLAGVTAILDAGGAQAIAALAYGTESLARVDKIVGPGNLYVACAKRLVLGACGIDSIAGPSEILVVADDAADPRVVAADLLSQAEHDEAAYPLLIASSEALAADVAGEVLAQLATLPRKAIASASVAAHGVALVTSSRERMAELTDALAVEHVSLQVRDPEEFLGRIHRAGAIFLGGLTPEAAGDYVAGPSHVLPTGGAVRFGAPLGVYDFVARSSVIGYSLEALQAQTGPITTFARLEGLEAHARAVEIRTFGGSRS